MTSSCHTQGIMTDSISPSPEATHHIDEAKLRLITYLVTGTLFMEVLDGTIIATALPEMARSFDVSAADLNLGMSAYLLALGVFIPLSSWIADRFSVRLVFATAIACFTLSSALCGTATAFVPFVALRALQGASGALMVPVGRIIVLRYTPQERLMTAISNMVWPALVAPVLGPPLGGFLTTHASWRWIFYLNVPLGLAAFALALLLVPNARRMIAQPFDWIGFAICGTGTFAILLGIERLASGIDLPSVIVTIGGISFVAAAVRHFHIAASPMLRLDPLKVLTFRTSVLGGSVYKMAVGSVPFLMPLMLQSGFGYTPSQAGLLMLALFAGNLGMKVITTRLLRSFGYRSVLIANGSLCILTIAACALMQQTTAVPVLVVILVLSGMTRSMQFTALGTLAFADLRPSDRSNANSLADTVSQVSTAAGISIAAMFVRLAGQNKSYLDVMGEGSEYRVAFVMMAIVAAFGLSSFARLPKEAGNHFVARR